VREVLRAADPDPYRDAVRDAVAAGDDRAVVALAARPEALAQPARFAAVIGQHDRVPVERRRVVLRAALRDRPGDLNLLLTMGYSYRDDQRPLMHQLLDCQTVTKGAGSFREVPEWNLRFYVRRGPERGVVFVREFVPRRLVAWLARVLYNEPYRAAPLAARREESAERVAVEYRITWGGRDHVLRATGTKPAVRPGPDSVEQFFKEHAWGFGVTRSGRPIRYEVRHPVWEVYPVRDYGIDVDWAMLYGPEWGVMQAARPYSVVLAKGSAVGVYPKGRVAADAEGTSC
jgi:hypothetical protein